MNNTLKRIILFDRISLIVIIAFILTLLLTITTSIYVNKITRVNHKLKTDLTEIQRLNERFMSLREAIESKERKIGLTKTKGIVATLEQILNALGLKANAIRPLQKRRIGEYLVEDAELEIHEIDLNSIVNLLYKIESFHVPMRIKETFIKTTFENPDKFILKITISLIGKA